MKNPNRCPPWKRTAEAIGCAALLAAAALGCTQRVASGPPVPAYISKEHRVPSEQTYRVRWIPAGRICVDGRADEPAWAMAEVEKRFAFPWEAAPAPPTEFRALWDDENLYFAFRVEDADIVVLDRWADEQDTVFEDRVEIYLSRDARMRDYFCAEIDPRGRVLDYRARFYRRFDFGWQFPGLQTAASATPNGYQVEGRIQLRALTVLGFPAVRPGASLLAGLYRAEFSPDRSGRAPSAPGIHTLGRQPPGPPPIERWISWVNPATAEPDFHVPASLGKLRFVK